MRVSLILIFLLLTTTLSAQQLKVFSDIPGRTSSDKYSCKVREVGSKIWHDAFVIQTICKVNKNLKDPIKGPDNDNGYFPEIANWSASYIAFEFSGKPVEVEISKVGGAPITKAKVRPEGHASDARIKNGKAYVVFDKNANVNVDIDGQMEDTYTGGGYKGPAVHTISIFANPVYKTPSAKNDRVIRLIPGDTIPLASLTTWDTIHFQPGVHTIGNEYAMYSNKVFYIPGDAIVHGTVHPYNKAKNWSVYGSGAISGEKNDWYGDDFKPNKTFTKSAEGARLEGFVVLDPANHTFNMTHTGTAINIYKNLKLFGWRKNADGINAFSNSEISDCFLRSQDDIFYLGTNVKIHDIVTWTDCNGAVLYLTKSDSNSVFRDISVIYNRKKWHGWNSGMISMRDRKRSLENAVCKNVHCEDPLPTVALFYGEVSGPDAYTFSNLYFENITQTAKRVDGNKTTFTGTPNTLWKGITIKNCSYNGKLLTGLDDDWNLQYADSAGFTFIVSQAKTFPVKLFRHPSNGGDVTGAGLYDSAQNVILTATPLEGFKFVNWTENGKVVSKSASYSFKAEKGRSLVANFKDISVSE